MNKKIVGFVLAMILTVGLGSSVLAATYLGNAVSANYEAQNNATSENGKQGIWLKIGSKEDTLSGNLSQTCKYFMGMYIGAEQPGGKHIIADGTGQKAIVSNSKGNWTVQQSTLTQEDLKDMPNPANYDNDDAYVAAMENFLKERGWKDSQLITFEVDQYNKRKKDSNGNTISHKLSADFYKQIYKELSSGLNHEVYINSGSGSTGPEVAIAVNGKEQYTFTSKTQKLPGENSSTSGIPSGIRVTSECDYNPDTDMLIGKKIYSFQATGETDGNGNAKYEWKMSYQASVYVEKSNGDGTTYFDITDYTANGLSVSSSDSQLQAAINAVIADYNDGNAQNKSVKYNGGTVTSYTVARHTSNSSLSSQYDSKKQETTYYDGKNATAVYNSKNVLLQSFEYVDGVMRSAVTRETDKNGKVKYTTVLYDKWGNSEGTLNGDYSGNKKDAGLAKIKDIKAKIKSGQITEIPSGSPVIDFTLDTNDLQNATAAEIANFKKYLGLTQQQIDDMKKFDYGNGIVMSVNMSYIKKMANTGDVAAGNITTNKKSTSAGTHTWHQTLSDDYECHGWKFETTIYFGGATADTVKRTVSTGGSRNILIESDPTIEGELWSADPTDEELKAAMKERGIDENDEEAIAALREELSQANLEKMADKLGIDKNDEEAMEDLKNGFYTDSNGETVAIVKANSINMEDGNGFQTADGEIVLSVVDKPTKDFMLKRMKETGDRSIMIMGDVRQSSTGYLTMAMNTSYGGGFVLGSEAIQEAKNDIMLISLGTAMQNGMDIKKVSAVLDNYNKANGTNFTTQDAVNKFKNAGPEDQWIINNTNANMKVLDGKDSYKAAWNKLVRLQLGEAVMALF